MPGILKGMPEPEHGDLRRLGERVRTERMARHWSKEAAARHAEMSSVTWNRVEDGKRVEDVTYGKMASAFRWKPDGLLRIMDGLEPEYEAVAPEYEPEPEPPRRPHDPYVAELEEQYGLDPDSAEAAAVLIRALQRKRDSSSPDQSKKHA